MKKILITLLLVIASSNICFAQGLLDNVLDAAQAINYGVPPSAILRDSAYDYAQQQINNTQQNTQNQNNYYQPAQYQNQQYQTNTQYQAPQANPYQNVIINDGSSQDYTPAQNPYVQNVQSYDGNFVIKPFGAFTYYDGLMDVINKLRAMQGITEIYLAYDGYPHPKTVNLKNIPSEKLSSVINAYLLKETANIDSQTFIDKEGKTRYYNYGLAKIEAKTVMIENTPFDITIRLLVNDVMSVHAPNKVFKDTKGRFYPLYITEISLHSNSYLTNSNWQKINLACKNKFATLLNNVSEVEKNYYANNETDWQVHDKDSNKFSFAYDEYNHKCELSYSSDNYKKYLNEFNEEHLKKIESQKYKSVPNSKI